MGCQDNDVAKDVQFRVEFHKLDIVYDMHQTTSNHSVD